jgi:hypothetical protein
MAKQMLPEPTVKMRTQGASQESTKFAPVKSNPRKPGSRKLALCVAEDGRHLLAEFMAIGPRIQA